MTIFEKFKKIKAFVFDVDGVLTNGEVLVTESGEQLRSFYIKDGYALQLAVKQGYPIAVITGGNSKGVNIRLTGLGIKDVFMNVADKVSVLNRWVEEQGLNSEEVLYMGDDVPDLELMKGACFPACPADAIEDIKVIAEYISPSVGGRGAVRDVIEKVMRLQNTWSKDTNIKSV